MAKGVDIGTSSLVSARELKTKTKYKLIRDAFFSIKPSTPMASKMIEKGLKGKSYFKKDGEFILIGQDAIDEAVKRQTSALRPMVKGVVSPKEQGSFDVLKYIIKELLGSPSESGEKVAYSVPAQPVDTEEDQFDVSYHTDVFSGFIQSLGFTPEPLNEAEAICYSELMEDDLTGISCSYGAGMMNICLMSSGEPILRFSLGRSGDFVDRMVAVATQQPDSVVQLEKEQGDFDVSISKEELDSLESIPRAIVIYYQRLVEYFWANFAAYLKANSKTVPKFQEAIPLVLSGGTSSVDGFEQLVRDKMPADFPIPIKLIRRVDEPLHAVANGCLLYASV